MKKIDYALAGIIILFACVAAFFWTSDPPTLIIEWFPPK